MATPEARKLELERKKQKLAEIREEKKRKEQERNSQIAKHLGASNANPGDPPPRASEKEMAEILAEVGINPSVQTTTSELPGKAREYSRSPAGGGTPTKGVYRPQTLVLSQTTQVNIPPRESVSYSKTTQTDSDSGGREFHQTFSNDWFEDDPLGGGGGHGGTGLSAGETPEEVFDLDQSPTHHLAGLLPHISLVKPAEVPTDKKDAEHQEKKLPDLSEEEKQKIVCDPEFVAFFDRSVRILERALTEKDDIFVDYSCGPEDHEKVDTGAKLSLNRIFTDEKWSKGRGISGLDWSLAHPELIAASYQENPDNPHEPAGVVLIWNKKFNKTTPEYVYHCQSRVTSVSFAKFHPNLILGGTYSGQICLWDNRQQKKTPVQRSPLSTSAHTHPVYSLQVVGTQNAHNIISVSTDGRMCTWSLDMLSKPQEVLDLTWKQSRQVAATSLAFPSQDVNNFLIGGEEGGVYMGCRHGSKAGVTEVFEGHFAPVTGINCHQATGQVDFSNLFLTSSFDWSVRLWNSKEPPRPVHSFEDHSDYVMDVAWSPIHPALFACVDAAGRVELWNLNSDTELPAAVMHAEGRPPLSRVMWLPSGHQLAVADGCGNLLLYDVNESLANPKADEWQKMARTLMDLTQAQVEAEELSQAMALGQSPAR